MRIIADCHEPAEILNLLRTADGVDGSAVEIEGGSLDVGDYLIGPGVRTPVSRYGQLFTMVPQVGV